MCKALYLPISQHCVLSENLSATRLQLEATAYQLGRDGHDDEAQAACDQALALRRQEGAAQNKASQLTAEAAHQSSACVGMDRHLELLQLRDTLLRQQAEYRQQAESVHEAARTLLLARAAAESELNACQQQSAQVQRGSCSGTVVSTEAAADIRGAEKAVAELAEKWRLSNVEIELHGDAVSFLRLAERA